MMTKFPIEFIENVKDILKKNNDLNILNHLFENKTGIKNFFNAYEDIKDFEEFLSDVNFNENSEDFGDFQTPIRLTNKICKYLKNQGFSPDVIFEPTVGEGNFIISGINVFDSLKYVYGVDVQRKYEWLFKLNILKLSSNNDIKDIKIEFHRDNVFFHQPSSNFKEFLGNSKNLLILGNPPWVTNSKLSQLNSKNLPSKSNIKGLNGIEAITGKSNFDIAEFILLSMINSFSYRKCKIAMLCKTSVVKNLIKDMKRLSLNISNNKSLIIDAKKEFGISADATLFMADIGFGQEDFCTVSSMYDRKSNKKIFGWYKDKFVSDLEFYQKYKNLDGNSPYIWRNGVKHDAIRVMVLKENNGSFINGLNENVNIEREIVYPFLKGSNLKDPLIDTAPQNVIITQKSTNEDTSHISDNYPNTWKYLLEHANYLDNRKSVVYKKRPRFSIFGIGDYSFKPYKIAIPGFYKNPNFSLILPINNKPVMLDDTSYYLAFNDLDEAIFTWILLNDDEVIKFLKSIVFLDSKRPFTKETLMRLDLVHLAERTTFEKISNLYKSKLKPYINYKLNEDSYLNYKNNLYNNR